MGLGVRYAHLLVALHEVADQDETAHGFILRHRLHVAACTSPQIMSSAAGPQTPADGARMTLRETPFLASCMSHRLSRIVDKGIHGSPRARAKKHRGFHTSLYAFSSIKITLMHSQAIMCSCAQVISCHLI